MKTISQKSGGSGDSVHKKKVPIQSQNACMEAETQKLGAASPGPTCAT